MPTTFLAQRGSLVPFPNLPLQRVKALAWIFGTNWFYPSLVNINLAKTVGKSIKKARAPGRNSRKRFRTVRKMLKSLDHVLEHPRERGVEDQRAL